MLGVAVFWAACVAATLAGLLPHRRHGGVLLLALAVAGLGLAAAEGSAPRRLEVVHRHPAFVGNQVEAKDFPIEVTQAPGYAFWLVGAAFCAVLGGLARAGLPARAPLGYAAVFAWTGIALALGLEKVAAPPDVLAFRLHAAVWLASIVAAIALARRRPRLVVYATGLWLLVNAFWLPAAIAGVVVTHYALGTSLDVHSIEFCAHRFAGSPLTFTSGSWAQTWHLLGLPFVVVFPWLTWFSAGGLGFLLLMLQRERVQRAAGEGGVAVR